MSRLPFKIKICGVTNADAARTVVRAGADAFGLNFYRDSKRFVPNELAREIETIHAFDLQSLDVAIVGVFVNHSMSDIARINSDVQLHWIQLHGDETPELLADVKSQLDRPIMLAMRWGNDGSKHIDEYLTRCFEFECLPDAILIDSYKPGEFGGTGETADWDAIAHWRKQSKFDIPLVLAGGLTPENVAEAIARVRPDAVDTASGVETSPGQKDPARIAAFVAAAKHAFTAISE